MQIKTIPEDFIVEELAHPNIGEGPFILAMLEKRELTTEDAIHVLVQKLNIPRGSITYAGAKDFRAITRQYITIRAEHVPEIKTDKVSLTILGRTRDQLSLGMLEGNAFSLVVRDIKEHTVTQRTTMPNYFDEQRFSSHNVIIGRHLLRGEFKDAAKIIAETDGQFGPRVQAHLDKIQNDAIGALRILPRNTLLLFVHAYQSMLYNEMLSRYILENDPHATELTSTVRILVPSKELPQAEIPLVGFASELVEPFASWCSELLTKDNLTPRDFVVRQLPQLSVEGTTRPAFVPIKNLVASQEEPDDLNVGSKKQQLTFALQKGSYATIAVQCLYASTNRAS